MNIDEVKNNCIDLIINDLNDYNYIPFYINTKLSQQDFITTKKDINEFISTIENNVQQKLPSLYCDIGISCSILNSRDIILKVSKHAK